MSESSWVALAVTFLGIFLSIIGFLIVNKMTSIQQNISLLWEEHNRDAANLAAYKLEVAKEHYPKWELDPKFEAMTKSMSEGFMSLGQKFDNLAQALIDHIIREERKQNENH